MLLRNSISNKINIFLLICLIVICNNCSLKSSPRYIQLVDEIVNKYSSELKMTKDMRLTGRGGALMYDVKIVSVDYLSFEAYSVDEARRLYVEIAEEYLKRINDNEEIRQYLHNYPFTINNLKIMISFDDITYHRRQDGYVGFMFTKRGNLYYEGYDEDGEIYSIYEEPYSESVQIVASEHNNDCYEKY